MWRSILFIFLFTFLGFVAGILSWIHWNWKIGLEVFVIVSCIGLIAAVINVFTIRRISTVDIFLPIPLAVFWTIILFPLHISSGFFSAGTFIGSAFMLSISLWLLKENKMNKTWIIFPTVVYLYEMLPVSIPGPFDDLFAFGGTSASVFLQLVATKYLKVSAINQGGDDIKTISSSEIENESNLSSQEQKTIDVEVVKD